MFLPLLHLGSTMASQETYVSPAARVFGVGELLENILLFVEQADVLRSRRVNKTFLEVISCSKPLRQTLFLEVDDTSDQNVNPLAPTWFHHKKDGYRSNTIAARIDLVDLWAQSQLEVKPLWHNMHVSQRKTKTCVIPVGAHLTIFHRRSFPKGITFLDLQISLISAFEIKKGRKCSKERLEELSIDNSVLIYWT